MNPRRRIERDMGIPWRRTGAVEDEVERTRPGKRNGPMRRGRTSTDCPDNSDKVAELSESGSSTLATGVTPYSRRPRTGFGESGDSRHPTCQCSSRTTDERRQAGSPSHGLMQIAAMAKHHTAGERRPGRPHTATSNSLSRGIRGRFEPVPDTSIGPASRQWKHSTPPHARGQEPEPPDGNWLRDIDRERALGKRVAQHLRNS